MCNAGCIHAITRESAERRQSLDLEGMGKGEERPEKACLRGKEQICYREGTVDRTITAATLSGFLQGISDKDLVDSGALATQVTSCLLRQPEILD